LDWTENVLVAAYFAVCADPDKDGDLWCMHHGELNWRSANWKACFPDTPPVRYLAAAAFLGLEALEKFREELDVPRINGPLALVPPYQFPRMAAQFSRFTIHPSATEREAQIESLLRAESLVRYTVPASAKAELSARLPAHCPRQFPSRGRPTRNVVPLSATRMLAGNPALPRFSLQEADSTGC
jgi:hypothetical protein